jgi:hypothetical protein
MVQVNTTYNIGIIPSIINPGTTASDQASFWNHNYGAILLIEEYYGGDFNAYYHTTNDLFTHYNQPYYHKMSRLTFGTLATLAELTDIVPVELTSFTATTNGKEVILNWSTATELNNSGFEIQRRDAQSDFLSVGYVKGHGTTTEPQNYSFADMYLDNGKYFYRLKQIDYDGIFEYSDVVEVDWRTFSSYLLEQNYPNPFNPTTIIGFGTQNKSNVKITVLNTIGEEVAILLNEEKESGYHQVEFNAANLPNGVYFYRIQTRDFVQTKKMILLK